MMASSQNGSGDLHVVAEADEIAALCLEGEFDLANAPQVIEESRRLLADHKHVILDLSEATFIDSSVIQALFIVGSEAKQNDRVAVLQLGTAAIVERILEITDIGRVLPRAKTRPGAIDAIREFERPRG